jgi:hypothetical protein
MTAAVGSSSERGLVALAIEAGKRDVSVLTNRSSTPDIRR